MTLLEWLMLANVMAIVWVGINLRNGFVIGSKNQVATFKAIQEIQSSTDAMNNYMRRYLEEKDNGNR